MSRMCPTKAEEIQSLVNLYERALQGVVDAEEALNKSIAEKQDDAVPRAHLLRAAIEGQCALEQLHAMGLQRLVTARGIDVLGGGFDRVFKRLRDDAVQKLASK